MDVVRGGTRSVTSHRHGLVTVPQRKTVSHMSRGRYDRRQITDYKIDDNVDVESDNMGSNENDGCPKKSFNVGSVNFRSKRVVVGSHRNGDTDSDRSFPISSTISAFREHTGKDNSGLERIASSDVHFPSIECKQAHQGRESGLKNRKEFSNDVIQSESRCGDYDVGDICIPPADVEFTKESKAPLVLSRVSPTMKSGSDCQIDARGAEIKPAKYDHPQRCIYPEIASVCVSHRELVSPERRHGTRRARELFKLQISPDTVIRQSRKYSYVGGHRPKVSRSLDETKDTRTKDSNEDTQLLPPEIVNVLSSRFIEDRMSYVRRVSVKPDPPRYKPGLTGDSDFPRSVFYLPQYPSGKMCGGLLGKKHRIHFIDPNWSSEGVSLRRLNDADMPDEFKYSWM